MPGIAMQFQRKWERSGPLYMPTYERVTPRPRHRPRTIPLPAAAIAYNSSADLGDNGGATNTKSGSYVCSSGANRLLVACVVGDSSVDRSPTALYGGASGTLLGKHSPGDRWTYFFYWLGPATGSNTLAVTMSATSYVMVAAADYTGVAQSGQPDASISSISGASTSSITTTITSIADNCLTILCSGSYDNGNPPSAGTATTKRISGSFGAPCICDSNGPITPAGSTSLQVTYPHNIAVGIIGIMASFAPALPYIATRPMVVGQAIKRASCY